MEAIRSLRSAPLGRLQGSSAVMAALRSRIGRLAPADDTVLIRGESGTGKELVARALHEQSPRRNGPFLTCTLAELPETLLESELFGYERGAFTGAFARKPGAVELARGGTLFLDEIGDLSSSAQVKILRLLQAREYKSVGGARSIHADVRFLAATHRDLSRMVREGSFRQDLFHRLNALDVWTPTLRQHREDIPELVAEFGEQVAAELGRPTVRFDEQAMSELRALPWPGNVRELQHFVRRLVLLVPGDSITRGDVLSTAGQAPEHPVDLGPRAGQSAVSPVLPLAEEVARAERWALQNALIYTKNNKAEAARLLAIGRRTFYDKLVLHGLQQASVVSLAG